MLIEAFRISESLRQFGISVPERHPWVKPIKKGDAIILGIGEKGAIKSVETIAAVRVAELSKIETDNQNSFPAFNFAGPIWRIPSDDPAWVRLCVKNLPDMERAKLLEQICGPAEFAYSDNDLRRLKARLQEFARQIHPLFAARPDSRYRAFAVLLDRIDASDIDVRTFLAQFTAASLRAISSGVCGSPAILQALLVGFPNAKKKAVDKITAFLDIDEYLDMPLRVTHPEMGDYFNRVLMAQGESKGDAGTCGLTGISTVLEMDKLPNPKLPILSNTILMSMFEEARCHDRYGMIGAKIFPIGKSVALDLQNALLWITAPERAGKTWRPIPSKNGDGSDLLITYLDQDPSSGATFADLFSEPSAEVLENKFEVAAESISRALDVRPNISDTAILYATVLRRINKGQVQVEITTQFTVEQTRRGYREWIRAAANHPPVQLPIPQGKGKPAIFRAPSTPFPAQVVRSTQSAWLRKGTHRAVPGIPLTQVYDVFLGDSTRAKPSARTLLRRLVERAGPLLVQCGHASHGRLDVLKELSLDARQAALLAVAGISIALFKLESQKEKYMSQPAFLIGRMLSLADTLHFEYCKAMRKGQVPPQLLGNALMPMALINPERSMAQLADRLRVYLGWAGAKGSGLARWVLAQYGEISRDLSKAELSKRLDDAEKAQLLFGYLARPEPKEEKDETEFQGEVSNV